MHTFAGFHNMKSVSPFIPSVFDLMQWVPFKLCLFHLYFMIVTIKQAYLYGCLQFCVLVAIIQAFPPLLSLDRWS